MEMDFDSKIQAIYQLYIWEKKNYLIRISSKSVVRANRIKRKVTYYTIKKIAVKMKTGANGRKSIEKLHSYEPRSGGFFF